MLQKQALGGSRVLEAGSKRVVMFVRLTINLLVLLPDMHSDTAPWRCF